jgi:hypothetical protein
MTGTAADWEVLRAAIDGRHVDARDQLRLAHELFTDFGMEGFAERTRGELRATGEHARKRSVDTSNMIDAAAG